jgi:hypothetical protein
MANRLKHFIARVSDLPDSQLAVSILVFLHELSALSTDAQPPPNARWQRIMEQPRDTWGAALDAACRECERAWPTQLDTFFGAYRFADQPAGTVGRAVDAVANLLSDHSGYIVGSIDRSEALAAIYQEMRSLTGKQWLGAFFTPRTVATAIAKMTIQTAKPGELWVCDSACGGAALLHAAYAQYREMHGPAGAQAITLIGVDIDAQVCDLARATLLLAGAHPDQYWIGRGNSLAQMVVGEDREGTLRRIDFDLMLGNPPFGTKVNMTRLQEEMRTLGPLVVPKRVLYRLIPVRARPAVDKPSRAKPARKPAGKPRKSAPPSTPASKPTAAAKASQRTGGRKAGKTTATPRRARAKTATPARGTAVKPAATGQRRKPAPKTGKAATPVRGNSAPSGHRKTAKPTASPRRRAP